MGSVGSSLNNTVTALHLTSESNIQSILQNGFDLSRSGQGAGDTWGDAVYFTAGELEKTFYSHRLNSNQGIQATIDTSKMLTVDLGTGVVKSAEDMYDKVIRQLPKDLQNEYKNYVQAHHPNFHTTQKRGLINVLKNHYTGLIIRQNQPNGFDPISGGNQLVVYDTSVIKNKRRR